MANDNEAEGKNIETAEKMGRKEDRDEMRRKCTGKYG